MFVGELCLVEMQPTDFSRKTTGFLVVRRMIRVVNNNVSSGVFACSCGGGGWKVHEEFGRMDLFLLLPRG